MALLYRRRFNFVGGLVEDNPLASSATTLNSAGLASIGTLATDEYMVLVLDPDGIDGAPEIVYLTAHTTGATSGTISKGQENTTARAHERDTPWVHSATAFDADAAIQTLTTQTASYTLLLTDAGRLVEVNNASANTLTVPPNSSVAFLVGTRIDVAQYGAGQTTLTPGSGVTLRSYNGALKLSGQYAGASLFKRATDEWYAWGNLST